MLFDRTNYLIDAPALPAVLLNPDRSRQLLNGPTQLADRRPIPPGSSVALVGLMGAGKSNVGRRLAARLGLPFRDADTEIEHEAGCTIAELFTRFGEPSFRDRERRVISRLLAGAPMVLATGGGAFMDAGTRALLRQKAVTVWLRCDLPVLLRRLESCTDRPLLQGGDLPEVLQRLMALRHPVYAEADLVLDGIDEHPDATTTKVAAALQSWRPS